MDRETFAAPGMPAPKRSKKSESSNASAGSSKTGSYHHGDLKPALIDAAREILRGPKGVAGLSLRSIATAIGVSHMAPYAHFKSKQELLLAIAVAGFAELAERMSAAQSRQVRGRELAVNYGEAYLGYALENPELYRVMMSQINPEGIESSGPQQLQDHQALRRPFLLLYAAFKSSRLDRATARARAIGAWSTVHGMAALLIDGHLAVPDGMDVFELFRTAVGSRR